MALKKDRFLKLIANICSDVHKAKQLSTDNDEHLALDTILIAVDVLKTGRQRKTNTNSHGR